MKQFESVLYLRSQKQLSLPSVWLRYHSHKAYTGPVPADPGRNHVHTQNTPRKTCQRSGRLDMPLYEKRCRYIECGFWIVQTYFFYSYKTSTIQVFPKLGFFQVISFYHKSFHEIWLITLINFWTNLYRTIFLIIPYTGIYICSVYCVWFQSGTIFQLQTLKPSPIFQKYKNIYP